MSHARPVITDRPSRLAILAAFAAIYLVWGSTYLAIRFAVETLPPFLMTAVRFLIAGALMYAWARARGAPRPTASNWIATALVGTLMLAVGVGAVAWAEQSVPSGIAALIVAVGPLWMVLIDWLSFEGARPSSRVWAGIVLGFTGVALLVGPERLAGAGRIDVMGTVVIVVGTITWAYGSLYSRGTRLPSSATLAAGMEMCTGAAVLLLFGTAVGEWSRLELDGVSALSLASVAYLAVFGSIVALGAYLWLLRVTTPARIITHAYVNPAVALLLGWSLADEPLNVRTLTASAVIIAAVLIILGERRR
ncbi:MAG: EamA family transporter [Gemmatimonadetes bacterium]|uniref:EamA family transporter n=1 Tax=Candidatus Kutchimonas denitrificans TaxID=3056748 RepID=A0AAE5C9B5_9BACT|nr:EamA family transporter [Gemmatimonadota bacterium]NIR75316.1 EamA family transporter [Candidatus Kutchimonas denitrificans]NIS02142.1 EamA family transporter [Gemmatimonadota bacterium]NIT67967.1 EamA family transporter [Gemmatimonadota bacterium]NIU53961.1 EamA family transporter [Gemmatimonadota bacterium]